MVVLERDGGIVVILKKILRKVYYLRTEDKIARHVKIDWNMMTLNDYTNQVTNSYTEDKKVKLLNKKYQGTIIMLVKNGNH